MVKYVLIRVWIGKIIVKCIVGKWYGQDINCGLDNGSGVMFIFALGINKVYLFLGNVYESIRRKCVYNLNLKENIN